MKMFFMGHEIVEFWMTQIFNGHEFPIKLMFDNLEFKEHPP